MNKRRIIIIHGWESSSQGNWFPWLKAELEKLDCEVLIPDMPNADHPKLLGWEAYLRRIVGAPNEDLYLVGHSLGVITILKYLESLREKEIIGGAVLVAGFSESIGYEELSSFFEKPLNYEKAKRAAKRFAVIHSDNDPYVPLRNGELLRDKLNAEFEVIKNGGHLNAEDGFYELPIALEKLKNFLRA